VVQRLQEDDLVGVLLETGGRLELRLPEIATRLKFLSKETANSEAASFVADTMMRTI
jgi:hypothetical protein